MKRNDIDVEPNDCLYQMSNKKKYIGNQYKKDTSTKKLDGRVKRFRKLFKRKDIGTKFGKGVGQKKSRNV